MSILSYTILSVLLVSLVSLAGVITLSLSGKKLDRIMTYLVSFATGSLFGGALIHLLPEAYATADNPLYVSLWTIGGLGTFFVMEKFFRWRHCHHPTTEDHIHPVVPMALPTSIAIKVPSAKRTCKGSATYALVNHRFPQASKSTPPTPMRGDPPKSADCSVLLVVL